jgi:hypothetical protein
MEVDIDLTGFDLDSETSFDFDEEPTQDTEWPTTQTQEVVAAPPLPKAKVTKLPESIKARRAKKASTDPADIYRRVVDLLRTTEDTEGPVVATLTDTNGMPLVWSLSRGTLGLAGEKQNPVLEHTSLIQEIDSLANRSSGLAPTVARVHATPSWEERFRLIHRSTALRPALARFVARRLEECLTCNEVTALSFEAPTEPVDATLLKPAQIMMGLVGADWRVSSPQIDGVMSRLATHAETAWVAHQGQSGQGTVVWSSAEETVSINDVTTVAEMASALCDSQEPLSQNSALHAFIISKADGFWCCINDGGTIGLLRFGSHRLGMVVNFVNKLTEVNG